MDRLHKLKDAAALLALHPNAVRQLIHDGKLHAKVVVVRGGTARPRQYLTQSEIDRFMRELPSPAEVKEAAMKARPKRGHVAAAKAEAAQVKQYV